MKKYTALFISLLTIFGAIFTYLILSNLSLSKCSSNNVLKNKSELTFYIASDIHYLSKDLTDNGTAFQNFFNHSDGKQINYISEIIDSFVFEIQNNQPDVLIISGDLTLNGEKKSHVALASKLKMIKDSGTAVYVIPGNHDINNPWASSFINDRQIKASTVSPSTFVNIYSDFGYKEALSKDSTSLSYLTAVSNEIYLLMLDDNNYKANFTYNSPEMNGSISNETLQWIKDCSNLAKSNNAKLIAVSHHNFINHSEYVWNGYTIDNNAEVLKTFEECEIQLAFSGHTHLQSIKNYSANNYSLYDISSSSLAVYPQKYGVLKTTSEGLSNYYTSSLNVDSWSKRTGTTDHNLLNFKEFSRSFYNDFVYNQNFNNLSKNYSTDEIKIICETIKNIRLKYDESLADLTWDDIRNSKGFELLETSDSPYLKHYSNIAIEGNEVANNKLSLTW